VSAASAGATNGKTIEAAEDPELRLRVPYKQKGRVNTRPFFEG
jgi:hypothetical protein